MASDEGDENRKQKGHMKKITEPSPVTSGINSTGVDRHRYFNFALWVLFAATFIFFYSLSPLLQNAGLFHLLLKTDALNSYLFYAFKDPRFLDFNFHGVHPYYIFLSLCGKFLSTGATMAFLFAGFVALFHYALRFRVFHFYTYALWLLTCAFTFAYNATGLLLWFQFGLYLLFEARERQIFGQWFEKHGTMVRVLFYLLLSGIFLPGLVMIFFLRGLALWRNFGAKTLAGTSAQKIKKELYPVAITVAVLFVFQATLALAWYNLPVSALVSYAAMPVSAYAIKNVANNIAFAEALARNITEHRGIYLALAGAVFVWLLILRDEGVRSKLAAGALVIAAGFLCTSAESVLFPLAAFFLLHEFSHESGGESATESTGPADINFTGKMISMTAILLMLFFTLLWSKKNPPPDIVDVGDENVVVSFADLSRLRFFEEDGPHGRGIKKLAVIDLKIIPENVTKLLENMKTQKLDLMLNDRAIAFLERDLACEKEIADRLEKDNYAIYLKSAIHPDQEKWPYRRVYNFWQILKKKDPAAKIVLF